jgi:hypothetical protein
MATRMSAPDFELSWALCTHKRCESFRNPITKRQVLTKDLAREVLVDGISARKVLDKHWVSMPEGTFKRLLKSLSQQILVRIANYP